MATDVALAGGSWPVPQEICRFQILQDSIIFKPRDNTSVDSKT